MDIDRRIDRKRDRRTLTGGETGTGTEGNRQKERREDIDRRIDRNRDRRT